MPTSQLVFFFCCCCFCCFCMCAGLGAKTSCPRASPSLHIVSSTQQAQQLKVLVPNITHGSFRQLVDCSDPSHVRGFCIDVFETALSILQPHYLSRLPISYTCFNFSILPNTTDRTLTYNDMIGAVANGSYDVVVGDVTIAAKRAYKLDFTHQYMESGIVIITKKPNDDTISAWLFFGSPFTRRMWSMVVGAFASTGFLLWILEHEGNRELNEGSFTKRINKVFWFIMEALVLLQRESIKSTAGQLVMVAWVFVVLLLTSSYTAGLSSILTATNLSTSRTSIPTIKDSNKTIAYRRGSITKDFLIERFHISNSQLKAIRETKDFIDGITLGSVFAIVDELPYANLMLGNLSCEYAMTGPKITNEGFGFGFRRGLEEWVKAFSIALLNLTESGCLQNIQNSWSIGITNNCSLSDSQSIKISSKSLAPLFIILIFINFLCLIVSYIYRRQSQNATNRISIPIDDLSISTHHEHLQRPMLLELGVFN